MAAIIPRWEWRAFASDFGRADERFAALASTGVQESDEVYLLGGEGAIVKVRDDLMDVKLLREVDANGLERWEPVMKRGFPLPATDAAMVCATLGRPVPNLTREAYTLDQFVDEVAGRDGPVKVHKRRVRYTVGGCTSEVSDVTANGRPCRTIAIEGEDAAAVARAVCDIGLGGYLNTNYPSGLTDLLADAPERYAVIDVGTNSVKLHIGERHADGTWGTIADRAELTRLGEGLQAHGEITPQAAERTLAAIAGMGEEARRDGARAIVAVGTAGLRLAANSAAVLKAIRVRTGVSIEVISGEEESRLAYLAVQTGLGLAKGSLVVFDTGGGSTQFTFGKDGQVGDRFSLNLGAVRLTERFGLAQAVPPDVLRQARAAIAAELSPIDGRASPDALVAMGGAVTNIGAVSHAMATYDPDVIQGAVLDRAEIERQIELYASQGSDARRSIVGLQPKRAEVILAGACIVAAVMDKLGKASLTVSDRGLRHGVLAERFGS